MRSPFTLLALVLALLTAGLPCHVCAPREPGGVARTVFVGSHAHPAPAACCCDDPECGGDELAPGEPGAPEAPPSDDGHGPGCCEHAASDAGMTASRVVLAPAGVTGLSVAAEVARPVARALAASFDAPVPRLPTETVVLLR